MKKLSKLTKWGLVYLDEDFNPISPAYVIEFINKSPFLPPKEQDPRLITLNEHLYIVYNNIFGPLEQEMRRMFIAQVHFDGKKFFITDAEPFLEFEGQVNKRMEKNWVPFIWENQLLLAYSLAPHRILQPLFGKSRCKSIASSGCHIPWEWGELRGGTPALIDDEEYLAFFHSYKNISTVQSAGKKVSHYFMGAYTFAKEPPFNITRISQNPIIGDKFYQGPLYNTWKPLRVVFPGGFISDKHYVWIVYGRQDHELWVVKLDKAGLFKSMQTISTDSFIPAFEGFCVP